MTHFTKRLLSKLTASRGLVLMRFPWSLVSIPLILLSWYHFSGKPHDTSRRMNLETARVLGGSGQGFTGGNQRGQGARAPGKIVTTSASDAKGATEGGADAEDPSHSADPTGAHDSNARCRAKVLGEWEDDYQGKRHLTVNDDGTGTMVVDLDGIGKKLFAARLAFDLEWSVADGRIVMKTLGGEPKAKVQLVLKLYGSEADYKILELTDERMLLLDADGKTKYDWRRPETTAIE
jgi:hypothetical protein